MEQKEQYLLSEIAQYLGIEFNTVLVWARTGILKTNDKKYAKTVSHEELCDFISKYEIDNSDRKEVKIEMELEKLYTAKEVCEFFGISRQCLVKWQQEGRIKYIKPAGGRTLRFKQSELQRIMQEFN